MNDFSKLGTKLKEIRTGMGLSLTDAAALTGVSKTMLSQIERSESVPTIAVVWKIANGLKIKFEQLLDISAKSYEVKSIDDMVPLSDSENRAAVYCIFPFTPVSGFEVFYGIFQPGCSYSSGNHKNSRAEYLTVTQGELTLFVGESSYTIKAGGAITFDSKEDHAYVNNGNEETIVQFIISY